jgi:WD40 repeat protein
MGIASEWANDSQRFLLEHFEIIHKSPSHIYHSALPLSPSSTLLHKFHCAKLSQIVKGVKGVPVEWGMCSRTVVLGSCTVALSHHKSVIAVASGPRVVILNRITGNQVALFSGHKMHVASLMFASDGSSLVSGSYDRTTKLWDVQTGGIIKTYTGPTDRVLDVSISADSTLIASGSTDCTIHLWETKTGRLRCVIRQGSIVTHARFSPIDPHCLMSASGNQVWQWDTNGHQVKPPFDGSFVAFSLDGTQLISYHDRVVTVESTTSRAVVATFQIPEGKHNSFHLSPDNKLVAVVTGRYINIWDITSSPPHLVETLNGHTQDITTLAFCSSSTFTSTSYDRTVRFWQVGASWSNPAIASPGSISTPISPIKTITIQAEFGIATTSHSNGLVNAWDISTGHCRASFQTPVQDYFPRDVRVINDKLILVWHEHSELKVWDVVEQKLLLTTDGGDMTPVDVRISGDGSQVFGLDAHTVCAWFIQTDEPVISVNHEFSYTGRLAVVGSKVWTYFPHSTKYEGWDFGDPDSGPVQLATIPTFPNSATLWDPRQARIINAVPRRVIFQLSGRFAKPLEIQCDGAYLVAGYGAGELLILDLRQAIPQ